LRMGYLRMLRFSGDRGFSLGKGELSLSLGSYYYSYSSPPCISDDRILFLLRLDTCCLFGALVLDSSRLCSRFFTRYSSTVLNYCYCCSPMILF
jgi:hypothetical protein